MKPLKFMLAVLISAAFYCNISAGDISVGSVPGEITYQGRLEKDNAPITGPIHLYFRIYDSLTGGNLEWESPEIFVTAVQGIFTASFSPPWSVFSANESRYLEVQIESDVLSPREPIKSVVYSLVAKRLEDGANIGVSSITANGEVRVNNNIRIGPNGSANGIFFPDNSFMNSYAVGSAGNLSNVTHAVILSDSDDNGSGDIIFRTGSVSEKMRIINAGMVGILTSSPMGTLDVDGSFYVGNEGIYDRDDGEVNIKEDIIVEGGRVTGSNSEYISLGETNDVITFVSGGAEKMRIHSNGNVGIGIVNPSSSLNVSGDIVATDGVRGGDVSIGDYSSWGAASNEIRSAGALDLIIQNSNSRNVGIGTLSPSEKLEVNGSVKASRGIIASTAAFSSDVTILGDFVANNPLGSSVELSSTVIYGTLQVTGGIGSDQGYPAYLKSTQTFTGLNSFANMIDVSSDIVSSNRIGVGIGDTFNFPGDKYLQIGDDVAPFVNDDARAYLVAGSNANSRVYFYRGSQESARLETQGGKNLALVVDNSLKFLINSGTYYVYNSALYVATSPSASPSIYVSPSEGNVGIGTSIMDPNWKLTVDGNLRLNSGALIFPDGSSMTTSSATSASSISNNDDALIQSDADSSGSGDIILRAGTNDAVFVNSGGNVGIGTTEPVAKLNVRGGDVLIGNTYNPYSSNSVEDLIIAGSLVVDGGLVQRSATPVELSALTVSGDVYLSTSATALTGIGNDSPGYKLDVTGDINTSGNLRTGGTVRISNTGTIGSGGANAAWDGQTIPVNRGGTGVTSLTSGGILYGNGTGAIGAMPVLSNGQLLIGDGSGAPAAATLTGTGNQVIVTNGAGSITLSLPQDVHTGASPTFAGLTLSGLTGMLKGNGAGALSAQTGISGRVTRWSDNNTIGASSILSDNGARFGVGSPIDVSGALTASSGTFTISGANQYSVQTSSGINILSGVVNMNNTVKIVNLPDPGAQQDAATKAYVDNATGGGAGAWGLLGNNINDSVNFLGTTGSGDDLVFKTESTERMRITSAGVIQFSNALDIAYGGTGATTASGARTNLGLEIGVDVQEYDADLADLADGTLTGSKVGSGVPAANIAAGTAGIDISGNAATVTNGVYTTGSYADPAWITSLAGSKISGDISGNAANVTGVVAIANGGTGATTPGGAQANLNVAGLGTAQVNYVVCLKSANPPALGYCTNISTTTGSCTCN